MSSLITQSWGAWGGKPEEPAEVADDPALSPGLLNPDEYADDVEDQPLPDVMPETKDLLQTINSVEQTEEALKSAKLKSDGGDLPDLPEETLSVIEDVHRNRDNLNDLTNRVFALENLTANVSKLSEQTDSIGKRLDASNSTISSNAAEINRIKLELSKLSNNLTSVVAASERRILAALATAGPAARTVAAAAVEPPTEVTTPGAAPIITKSSQSVAPAPAPGKKRVVLDGWN